MLKVRNQKKTGWQKAALSVSLLLCSTVAMAQSQKTGRITDANGEPLVGVTVMEEGTSNGTTTDADGRYTLSTTKAGARLKVSYVGYEPQTIGAGESAVLQDDSEKLNEVVVVGYGTMRRKDVTSSITTVQAKDLNQGVYTDPAQLLQGKVAGLVVTTDGNPSGTPSISLRGASSLRSGEAMEPYYVIDGIPGMDLSLVAPDDIESIDVLRDASATAIYGSKAANGVIIITTKKGRSGRTSVSYSGYVSFDNTTKKLDMMDAGQLRRYAADNGVTLTNDEGANTNWADEVLRTAVSHNHNVSISGGNDKTTFNASVNYMNREGVVRGTDFNRLNGRALVQTSVLKDRLNLALGLNASESNFNAVQMGIDGASVMDAMYYYSPLDPVYNADGSFYEGSGISQYYNPIAMISQDRMKNKRRRFQLTTKADVKIIDGFTWTAQYTYGNNENVYSGYNSVNSQIVKRNGQAERNMYQGHRQTFETYGNFTKTFNQKHVLGLMAGYSWEENVQNDGFGVTVYNFYNDDVSWHNLSYANSIDGIDGVTSGAETRLRMISFYGRVNYGFDSKYNFQATIRRDGSSAFGKNHRWGTFPSVSAAWRVSEEPWMKQNGIFDNLKLRVGYGVSGNSLGFGAYDALLTYKATGWFSYTDANGNTSNYHTIGAANNANQDLKWERTGMFNVGVDFSVLHGRLNGTVEYYYKKTTDLIHNYKVSTNRYPYDEMIANVGDISNEGFEVTINAVPVKTQGFTWNTSLNLSHNKNKVKKLSNQLFSVPYIDEANPYIGGYSNANSVQRIMEGEPLGTFYTWEWAGYSDDGTKSVFYVHDAETNARIPASEAGEGDMVKNGYVVTDNPGDKDRTKTGCAQPDLTLGWNNTLTYRHWSLGMFFQGVFGNDIFNATRAQYNAPSLIATGKNALAEIATKQKFTDTGAQAPSDRYIENGSYLRLKTLTLGYTFTNLGGWLTSLQLYGTVNNVFTITGYDGIDPEVYLGGLEPGMDSRRNFYPHTRSFMLGVKVNF